MTTAAAHGWPLPDRGRVGIAGLIVAESAMFAIFVTAHLYYLGKSLGGPTAAVLTTPLVASLALWSSSATVEVAVRALRGGRSSLFVGAWVATLGLGILFLGATAGEWQRLIVREGLTIRTNLFGSTFCTLVGLHAAHVLVGLGLLATVLALALGGRLERRHARHAEVVALYWHFVDAVWLVVFLVVYVLGR
jgi:cytochrome c oxidase subunit 3/cytochrome o ubiquinol oxidase subunit 3